MVACPLVGAIAPTILPERRDVRSWAARESYPANMAANLAGFATPVRKQGRVLAASGTELAPAAELGCHVDSTAG